MRSIGVDLFSLDSVLKAASDRFRHIGREGTLLLLGQTLLLLCGDEDADRRCVCVCVCVFVYL